MIRPVLKWLGRRYQRHLGVETPYFDELVEHAPDALVPIIGFVPATAYGRHLPISVLHMVRLGATVARECGTCLEIGMEQAARDGVPRSLLARAVRQPGSIESDDLRLALRFGERLARGLDPAEEREALRARFGDRGVVEASVAVAGALTFPALQRGMGHARACDVEAVDSRTVA